MGRGSSQQGDGGRCGNRDRAVGRFDRARSRSHTARPDLVDIEHLEGGTRADHVHDAVDGTHLVEVHVGRRNPMKATLDGGQCPEGVAHPSGHAIREAGSVDHGQDRGRVSVGGLIVGLHPYIDRRDPTTQDRLCGQRPTFNRKLSH